MHLYPQISCVLQHWGSLIIDDGEPALRRLIAASTQETYARHFGMDFLKGTVRSRFRGLVSMEPVFLVLGPALDPTCTGLAQWVDKQTGTLEMRVAGLYGAIFLVNEGEDMGFLVERLLSGKLCLGMTAAVNDVLHIARDVRTGRCSRCKRCGVTREVLPRTLLEIVKET